MNFSALRESIVSKNTALVARHENKQMYSLLFTPVLESYTVIAPVKSTAVYLKGLSSVTLSFGSGGGEG